MTTLTSSEAAAATATDPVPTKKGGRGGRKALKNITTNEVNISARKQPPSDSPAHKESREGLSLLLSPEKRKPISKAKAAAGKKSSAAELEELMGRFEKLKIEKEKTEKLLSEREEMLKKREEEIEEKGREQEKLQKEMKKLRNLKEFKPTMNIPIVQSLREKEQSKDSKKKKSKDFSEIKKPSPAYILYCKDQWNAIKKEKPELGFKDISNILGGKWKNLTAEEKRPYEETYQQEKEAYLQVVGKERREKEAMKLLEEEQLQKTAMELLEQYLQFKHEADKEENNKPKKEKDPLKPKQPMSAFFHFSSELRATLLAEKNHKNIVEIAKIAGEEWKNMNEEKRAPYEEAAKKQKEEYLQQMEIYRKTKAEEALSLQREEDEQKKILKQEALQLLKKKEKTEIIIKKTKEVQQKKRKQKKEENSDPNKPKRPASAFLLFSKDIRKDLQQERPDVPCSTMNALISVKWKELSEEERRCWSDKAAGAMAAYKKEMELYNNSNKSSSSAEEATKTTTS